MTNKNGKNHVTFAETVIDQKTEINGKPIERPTKSMTVNTERLEPSQTGDVEENDATNVSESQKSIFTAYLLWFLGGPFGLHLLYLRRDRQMFTWITTIGGYFFIGYIGDFFRIPKYVRAANNEKRAYDYVNYQIMHNKTPPFSFNRFICQITVGYFWAQVIALAVPAEEVFGINFKLLHLLVPLGAALGVWNVGNIGYQKGDIWWALIAAYVCYPLRFYLDDESVWLTILTAVSTVAFDTYSKKWRKRETKKRSFAKRIAILSSCILLYLLLVNSFIFFNGTITDSSGEEIPVREAIQHFFTSPWWLDLKNSLYEIYIYAQQHGWYEIWKQIIDLSDPTGELNAYRTLEISQFASQSEITASWRKLSRLYHPDKVKDPVEQKRAQEKFMQVQQAYETLSKIKSKRQRKNKKSNDEF